MNIVERAKKICLTPSTEWPVIAEEATAPAELITGYALPLAAIGAIAGFIGGSLLGGLLFGSLALFTGLVGACFVVIFSLIGVFVLSLIINALAPTFAGQKNSSQALKVAVYSVTPAWVAGVLQIVPFLGGFLAFLIGLYGLYLLYLGLPRLMKCPDDKAIGYTAVVVVCAVVVSIVTGAILGAFMLTMGLTSGLLSGWTGRSGTSSEVQLDNDSPLGALGEFGKKMEEAGKKMEAAEKSGDTDAQVGAALEGLGALFGGGKRVDPIGIEELKPFVPDTFAGLPKTRSKAEKTGLAGLMVSTAEATYGDGGQKEVTLEITDTGGVSGLMGLASWMGVMGESEDENGTEKTHKVDGRIVHEKTSKRSGGTNEFGIVMGDRFMVSAKGRGVDVGELKSAVSNINLARLESLKDVGVQK